MIRRVSQILVLQSELLRRTQPVYSRMSLREKKYQPRLNFEQPLSFPSENLQ